MSKRKESKEPKTGISEFLGFRNSKTKIQVSIKN